MMRFAVSVSVCGVAAMLVLQGCGGGGGGSDTTTTTTIKTTTPPEATTTPAGPAGPTTTPAGPHTKPTTTMPITSSTTTPRVGPKGLRLCEDIDTFLRNFVDGDGNLVSSSQCKPSTAPGAYYTKAGQKDPDGTSDKMWACLNVDNEKHDQMNDATAKQQGFEGACEFDEFGTNINPSDVGDCLKQLSHHPAVCAPGPSTFWGACFSEHTEQWHCISKDDNLVGFASGDCKAQVVQEGGAFKQFFYDGVCRFPPEIQKFYKCDTVPSYDANSGSTCGRNVQSPADKACFSLKAAEGWQCMDTITPFTAQPCDWTVVGGDKPAEFFAGACVFDGNPGYAEALTWNSTDAPQTVVV